MRQRSRKREPMPPAQKPSRPITKWESDNPSFHQQPKALEHKDDVKGTLDAIAKTDRQRDVLDQMMVNYRRGYITQLSNVLLIRTKTPENTQNTGKLSRFVQADMAFQQWQRKAMRDMKNDLLAAEWPDARWTQRIGQVTATSARDA